MKIQLKFIFTTIISAIVMLLLSSVWHSVLLHDFQALLLTFNQLIIGLIVFYIGMAVVLVACINRFWNYFSLPKAILFSAGVGLFFYILATLLGHTFNDSHTKTQLIIDTLWQIIEQGTGGFVVYSLLNIGYNK